ncbi:UNVERIFIED_ORG: hypothetical protein J2Y81_005421 [Paraburkholderia sediminicola]|nr:hypothetical protein [Paraburkholderia sediminicola]
MNAPPDKAVRAKTTSQVAVFKDAAESAADEMLSTQDGLTIEEAKRPKENYLARIAQTPCAN